jgi:hypothetical protein
MFVKNEILWYKLSVGRIEFSALSDASGEGEEGNSPARFANGGRGREILFESRVTH